MPRGRCALFVLAVATALVPLRASDGPDAGGRRYRATDSGIVLDLTVRQLHPSKTSQPFREGDEVAITLSISDETSGKPIAGVFPTAWMSRQRREPPASSGPARCRSTIARFVAGSLLSRPDVDLNAYHVLALNTDPTITVVDPHFSFGGSQLLALVPLQSPGEDWTLNADQSRLFVSMPDANSVAVIDAVRWAGVGSLDVGPSPRRVARQPDGAFVWVTTDEGVAAVHGDGRSLAFRVTTGRGPHDLAISSDSRFVFVTNRDAGTTSVIDVHTRRQIAEVPSGRSPVTVSYSSRSAMAYVGSDVEGAITVIDPRQPESRRAIAAKAGLRQIRVTPNGRYAFVANPASDIVEIVDVASNRIVQVADVEDGPFEVTFSTDVAYVRRLRSELVVMMGLTGIGGEGQPVSIADFPGGEHPFGGAHRPTPADGVVQAPGERAVLVANAADKTIYYYQEGMAAPMGNFNNYSHEPRAVMVVDRTLREAEPGAYRTTARLARPGSYDVAVLVDSPRAIACFDLPVEVDPALEATRRPPVLLQHVTAQRVGRVGERVTLRVRLLDPVTGQAKDGLTDVRALVSLTPGHWHTRTPLHAVERGEYALEFVPPDAGVYYVYVESPSAGLKLNNPYVLTFQAIPG